MRKQKDKIKLSSIICPRESERDNNYRSKSIYLIEQHLLYEHECLHFQNFNYHIIIYHNVNVTDIWYLIYWYHNVNVTDIWEKSVIVSYSEEYKNKIIYQECRSIFTIHQELQKNKSSQEYFNSIIFMHLR